ncbi:hypothetical protein ACIQTZ_18715 [Paenarthrobacter sp. NPDC090520]|uniref:hypothetical protein n=1 Tax=unclassified Paenarthrobacter TaxID=2634190 RepID=UPI0037FD4650
MQFHVTNEWQSLPGSYVEVYRNGELYRCGIVEEAMHDASAVWLAADERGAREYIGKADGYYIWTELYPRSPMTPFHG